MKRIYKSVFVLLVGLGFIACEGIVDDLNKDPNNATDAPARYVFKGMEVANMAAQEGLASRLAIVWTGYGKGTFQQLGTWYLYQITASNFDDDWNLFFSGVNKNAIIAIEKAEALGNRKMAGIAKIVQVNGMGTATELWGDIPYTEAGNTDVFPNPKFESQAELYPKLLARLDEGIADIESGVGIMSATDDIYLAADATKWIQVGYTLKARLLTDMKQYDAALTAAATGVSAFGNSLYALHGITTNADENANYSFLTNIRAGSITGEDSYLAFILNPANPRYRGNAKTNETARFRFYYLEKGVNAVGVIEPNTSTTTTARGFFARDASFPLVTYQENVLTLAESSLRAGKGFNTALGYLNSYRAFLNGGGYIHPTYRVAGTYRYEPYGAEDFAAGGMENADGIAPDQALLREILEERYVTFYGQHMGWNDERRTRSEAVGIKITPSNGTQLPGRFIYSQNELNSNTSSPAVAPGLFEPISIYK